MQRRMMPSAARTATCWLDMLQSRGGDFRVHAGRAQHRPQAVFGAVGPRGHSPRQVRRPAVRRSVAPLLRAGAGMSPRSGQQRARDTLLVPHALQPVQHSGLRRRNLCELTGALVSLRARPLRCLWTPTAGTVPRWSGTGPSDGHAWERRLRRTAPCKVPWCGHGGGKSGRQRQGTHPPAHAPFPALPIVPPCSREPAAEAAPPSGLGRPSLL